MMTENDKRLIAAARKLDCIYWSDAAYMANKADTEEARRELDRIASWLYHEEEGAYI